MRQRKLSGWVLFLLGAAVCAALFFLVLGIRDGHDKEKKVLSLIERYALTEADEAAIEEGKYDGIMGALGDPYAAYYTEEETNAVEESRSGIFMGLGITIVREEATGYLLVVDVYPDCAAAEAGFLPGDRIVTVDGRIPDDLPDGSLPDYVQEHLTDEIVFEVLRNAAAGQMVDAQDPNVQAEEEMLTLRATPGPVTVPAVLYQKMEDGTGYLRIVRFVKTTPEQFAAALSDLTDQKITGLVIDLRGNPGGLIDSVKACLDEILPEGLEFYTVEKDGTREDYHSAGGDLLTVPAVLLVDEDSASAAEIFAGACRDRIGTPVVGVTTYGKGIVQTTHFLEDGSSVKFTTAHYYTPDGVDINGTGIVPDIIEEADETMVMDASDSDNQYQRALEVLKTLLP